MFLVHEARGSGSGARCQGSCHTQWAAYPGEGCLISRMWAGNVTHGAVFSGSGGWPGIVFRAPSSPVVTACGSVRQKVLRQGAPRKMLQDQALGEPLCQGLSEAPVQGGDGRPVYGNPILSPRIPLYPGCDSLASLCAVRAPCWRLFIAHQ